MLEVAAPDGGNEVAELDLGSVLHALSDPTRLQIVSRLADAGELCCGAFELPITKSTSSHHFRVLREAGVIAQHAVANTRVNVLRREQLEERFPGLLDAILNARRS